MTDASLRREPKPIPPELDRWNWGAFLLSWIWGIGNNTFIALLTLVPFFGILIMPFVLGAKGSRWAWRNGRWDDVAHFKRVQRLWAIWGAVIWIGAIIWFGVLFGGIFYSLKNSEAYAMAASRLQASAEAATALGTPISTGFPWGSVSVGGGSGRATLTFSATGPKAQGRVFVDAIREAGVWSIRSLMLRIDGRDGVIDLLRGRSVRLEEPGVGVTAAAGRLASRASSKNRLAPGNRPATVALAPIGRIGSFKEPGDGGDRQAVRGIHS